MSPFTDLRCIIAPYFASLASRFCCLLESEAIASPVLLRIPKVHGNASWGLPQVVDGSGATQVLPKQRDVIR